MSDVVTYEVDGHVGIITLNRPEARNAVNGDVAAGARGGDRPSSRTIPRCGSAILRANTEGQERPVFCAGADLKAINAGNGGRARHRARRLRRLRLPRAHASR